MTHLLSTRRYLVCTYILKLYMNVVHGVLASSRDSNTGTYCRYGLASGSAAAWEWQGPVSLFMSPAGGSSLASLAELCVMF